MMTFQQALRLLEVERTVTRKSSGLTVKLSSGTAAVLITQFMGSVEGLVDIGDRGVGAPGNWFTLRVPLIENVPAWEPWVSGKQRGFPYIFTDEDLAATDWELVP